MLGPDLSWPERCVNQHCKCETEEELDACPHYCEVCGMPRYSQSWIVVGEKSTPACLACVERENSGYGQD